MLHVCNCNVQIRVTDEEVIQSLVDSEIITKEDAESYTPTKGSETGVIMTQQGEKEVYSKPQDLPSANGDVDTSVAGLTSNDALKIQEFLLGKVKSL